MEEILRLTGYCGLYCKDCIFFESEAARLAKALKAELERIDFDEYAKILCELAERSGEESPFSSYQVFRNILGWLGNKVCTLTCREGSKDCGLGEHCPMRTCAQEAGLAGCWQCPELERCEHFRVLNPICGDAPRENALIIRKKGLQAFEKNRMSFYRWQQTANKSRGE